MDEVWVDELDLEKSKPVSRAAQWLAVAEGMGTDLDKLIDSLTPERREKIANREKELLAELKRQRKNEKRLKNESTR